MNSAHSTANGTHVGKTRVRAEVDQLKGATTAYIDMVKIEEYNRGYHRGWESAQEQSPIVKAEWAAIGFVLGLMVFAVVGALFGMRFA